MKKKEGQRIKNASKLLVSALMIGALSFGSINPVEANSNIVNYQPITQGKDYIVRFDRWIPFAREYFWRHDHYKIFRKHLELTGGTLRLMAYWNTHFLVDYTKIATQKDYWQTSGNLLLGRASDVNFAGNSKITGGTIVVGSDNIANTYLYLNCGDVTAQIQAYTYLTIGDDDYATVNLLPDSDIGPGATLNLAKYGTLNVSPTSRAVFDYPNEGYPKGHSSWNGAINSKGFLTFFRFPSTLVTDGRRKLKAEGGVLTLVDTKLTLKPESVITNTTINLRDNNSGITFANKVLNIAAFQGGEGIVQIGDDSNSSELRILPYRRDSKSPYEPYYTKTTVLSGSRLEFNDRNVASPTITINAPITNNGYTDISDAIISGNITNSSENSGTLRIYRNVNINDNASIKQSKINVFGTLINPSSTISAAITNYGIIDGKDGKYGNLILNQYNTTPPSQNRGSIVQNDVNLLSGFNFNNSGYLESKGNFTSKAEFVGDGSLTVNNAEFNDYVGQGNLTVNGNAVQKGDINITNQLSVSSTGKITNENNKITVNSLDNKGNISGNGTIEVNSGSNIGMLHKKDVTIKNNFKNDGDIKTNNLTTQTTTNISGNGTMDIDKGTNNGNITQKDINITSTFENKGNITSNAKLTNSGTITGDGNLIIHNGGSNADTSEITQKIIKFNNGTFDNNGVITANGDLTNSAILRGDNGTLNIKDGSNTNTIMQGTINITPDDNSIFYNHKEITANLLNNNSGLENEGNITANTLNNNESITNKGNVTANTINNNGYFANEDNITANTLNNENHITGLGSLTVLNGGYNRKIGNAQTISVGNVNFSGGTFNNEGIIESIINFTNNATIVGNTGNLFIGYGTGVNNGNITQNLMVVLGKFTNNGNISTTKIINENGGAITNAIGKSIETNNLVNSGTISGEGNLIIQSDGKNIATITSSGTLINNGTFANIGRLTSTGTFLNNGTYNNYEILTSAGTQTNNGTFNNYGILSSSDKFTNNGTLNFDYDERHLPIAVINKMDGTGTTNINGGIVSLADVRQGNINVQNGLLSLVDDNTDNRVNTTNFYMSNNARLMIDVDLTNKDGDYFKSDRIVANTINANTVVNVAYTNLLNIPSSFTEGYIGKIKLFGGSGVNSNLTINDFAEVVNGDPIYAYVFEQDTDNKGDMNINQYEVTWSLPEVIQAQTKIGDETFEVSSYRLKQTETLERALGNLTNYDAEKPRELTINGNNNIIDGVNNYAGVSINGTNQKLTLKDVTMKNFIGNNSGGVINNSGQLDITNSKFDNNKAGGTYPNGGAIYNTASGKIKNLQADFTNNEANHSGGALYNLGTIDGIKGKFEKNRANLVSWGGGAIMNYNETRDAIIQKISSDFIANSAYNGGAIYNNPHGKLNIFADEKDTKFDGNYLLADNNTGGAIYNAGTVGLYALAGKSITFTGDKPSGITDAFDIDGIYNTGTLNINGNGTDIYTGTISLQAVNGTGDTNIYGGTVNANKNYAQNNLNNQGIFNFNATTGTVEILSDNATAKGTTNINTGSFTVNSATTQKAIAVNNGATLTTKGNVTTTDGIKNAGTLNLLGGVNIKGIHRAVINSTVSGDGTTNFGDNSNNAYIDVQKAITQAININAKADVLTNVNNIGGTVTNAGVLRLTGENSTLANAISGLGSTVIDGTGLTTTANIGQAITINATKDLTADANLIGGTVNNSGTLNLKSGMLTNNVTGEGATNILAGESVSITNGKTVSNLTLGEDSTLNLQNDAYEKITIGKFNAGSNGNLAFDVGTVNNNNHDEIEILNSATGTLNLTGINIIGDNLNSGTMSLFKGSGTKTLDIPRVIIAISGTNNYYKFTQNSTNKGDIDVLKIIAPDVPWSIQEVIAGETKTTVPGEIVPVDVYQLSSDMTLSSALGTFTRYPETRTRELTINGVGHTLDGNNTVAGVTVNSGDTLNFNNASMKHFKDGAIHNSGEVSIIAQGGNAVMFDGNYLTTDAKGGAIYNGKTDSGDDVESGTINLIAKTANDSITFVGGTETGKFDIDGIYNDGTLDINADYNNIYSGTVNLYTVNGTGETTIYGGNVTAKGDIVQNDLNIIEGASLTANARNLKIAEGIYNGGILNLAGAEPTASVTSQALTSSIIGEGIINITSGRITTDKLILQAGLNIANGATLTIGADNLLTVEKVQNAGTLNLSTGTLEAPVTGSGNTNITGDVIAIGHINNNVTINENSSIELDANELGNVDDGRTNIIENKGTIVLADNTLEVDIKGNVRIKEGATVSSDITHFTGADAGTLTNNGTFNMTGDIVKNILGTSGTTVLQSDEVYINNGIVIEGILDSNGKKLSLQSLDEKYNKFTVGGLKGTTNLSIDVDMNNNTSDHSIAADSNRITLTGTSTQTEGENAVLNLQDIFAYGLTDVDTPSTAKTYNNFITYATTSGSGTLEDNITLKLNGQEGADAKLVTAFSIFDTGEIKSREYKFTLGNPGSLNVDVKDTSVTLEQFIDGSTNTEVTSFILASDYKTTGDAIGTTKLGINEGFINRTSPLYLTLVDGSKIIAKTEGISKGITVDNGIELTVQGTDFLTSTEQGRMSGFDTALKVNEDTEVEKNILNIEDMIITNNKSKTDIENNATLNFGGSNNEVGTIVGTGSTNINEGKLIVNNELTQNKVTLEYGAELETSADALNVENGIINHNGTVVLKDGSLTTNIFGLEGLLNIKENEVTNNATIIQEFIAVESTLKNDNTIAADYIDNTNTVTNNGLIFANYIDNNDNGIFNANQNSIVQGDLVDGKFNSNGNNIFAGTLNPTYLNLKNGMLNMLGDLSATNTVASGGSLNLADGIISTAVFGKLTLADNMNLLLDSNLATASIDKISADSVSGTSKINMMLNIQSRIDTILTNPNIKLNPIANDSSADLKGAITHNSKSVITPIFKYDTNYDPETGLMHVATASGGANNYNDLNPAIASGEVAAQMGGYLNLIQTYENAFEHMDTYMLMTSRERLAMKMRNRYAAGVGSNLMTYNPNQIPEEQRGMWVKPFASFEKVNLNNGPKVENNTYGTFLGGDSDLIELKNGWDAVFSGHVSYNGSHQNYDGVSIYQNGGTLGGTATFYKNNFFTGLTANVGASVAEASTMYGQDNMTMLLTGIANKTGYNWELLNSKLIIQPSMLISYSFVNTFDFQNAAGVKVHSNPLNAIQLAPGLKFIGNLPNGWQPYIGLQMVWNIMDDSKVKANDVWLPATSVDPYFQYGVGVQKRWGERFNGFFQTMIRNGGRTGIAFSAGFRWAIGNKPSEKNIKSSTPELKKTKINLKSAS